MTTENVDPRCRILGQRSKAEHSIRVVRRDIIEPNNEHQSDSSLDATGNGPEKEFAAALAPCVLASLAQCDSALEALDAGRYGVCADCHKKIPEKRLAAHPAAVRCVPCQEQCEA